MEEVELAELPPPPPPAEPIAEPEKKKRAKKDDAPKPKVVRRKKVDEQPVVDVQPSFVAPPLNAGFFQQLGKELRDLEVQSTQKRLSSLSIV